MVAALSMYVQMQAHVQRNIPMWKGRDLAALLHYWPAPAADPTNC